MIKRSAVAFTVVLMATSCVPRVQHDPSTSIAKIGQSPEIGARSSASVGSVMYTEYNYIASQKASLRAAFQDNLGPFASVSVSAGADLKPLMVAGKQAYCTTAPAYMSIGERRSICFFDSDGNSTADKYWVVGTLESITYDVPNIPISRAEAIADAGGFKYELLYQGIDRNVVRVSYREFTGNLARPAFQQDLTYTLADKGPTQVAFRSLRIEIEGADNNNIQYRVTKAFDGGMGK